MRKISILVLMSLILVGVAYADIPNPGHNASSVAVGEIGTATYDDALDFFNLFTSAGRISGGHITANTGQSVNISAGSGLVRVADDDISSVKFFDWTAATDINVANDTVVYIGVEYNGGSPRLTNKTTDTWDLDTEFPLGSVINQAGDLYVKNDYWWVSDGLTNIIERFKAEGVERDDAVGGLILSYTGTRNPTLSAGVVWSLLNEFTIDAKNCATGDTFYAFYRDGGTGWTREGPLTQWNNTHYDDNSGTLAELSANKFANIWVFVEIDTTNNGTLMLIYPQVQYNTAAEAEAAAIPAFPSAWYDHGILVGRILFKKGVAAPVEVQSAFTTTFKQAQATDHGNLAGLADDDHTQYVLDAGDTMTNTLTIDQNGNGIGLNIDSEATTATSYGLQVQVGKGAIGARFQNSGSTEIVDLLRNDTGYGMVSVYNNVSRGNALLWLENDLSTNTQTVANIQQDANTYAVFIDQNGNGIGLSIDSEATTSTNYGLQVDTAGGAGAFRAIGQGGVNTNEVLLAKPYNASGGTSHFYRNIAAINTAAPVVFIEQDHASDDQSALSIQNDGTGNGLFIDQNGNADALNIDHDGINENAIVADVADVDANVPAVQLIKGTTSNYYINLLGAETAATNIFYRNRAAANTTDVILKVDNQHASDDQGTAEFESESTGTNVLIDQNGNGIGLSIDSEATTFSGLTIAMANEAYTAINVTLGMMYIREGIINHWDDFDGGLSVGNNMYSDGIASNIINSSKGGSLLKLGNNSIDFSIYEGSAATIMNLGSPASNANAVTIYNAGTGNGLLIDQNGDAIALNIDSEASTATNPAINIQNTPSNSAISIASGDRINFNGTGGFAGIYFNGTHIVIT